MKHSNKCLYKQLIDIHLSKYPNINLLEFNEDFNNLLKTEPLYKKDFPILGELTNLNYSLYFDGTLNVQPKTSLQHLYIYVNISPFMNNLIGYQIVSDDGKNDIPDCFWSFEVLKDLHLANAWLELEKLNSEYGEFRWVAVPVFEGDIEEYTVIDYI